MRESFEYPLFVFTVHLIISDEPEMAALESCNGVFLADDPAATYCEGREAYMVFRKKQLSYGVVAHECLHAVNFMLDAMGHIGSVKDDEVVAYCLDDLVNRVHMAIDAEGIYIGTE